MSEESIKIIEAIMESTAFRTGLGVTISTLLGWILIDFRNTRKKIKEAPTKDDLNEVKNDAFKYTDDRMKIHEDLQVLEITNIKDKIMATHDMVKVIYDKHIK